MKKFTVTLILAATSLFACKKNTTTPGNNNNNDTTYHGTGSMTKGTATVTVSSLYSCNGGRVTAVGTITSSDGKVWTVPAENNFAVGQKLPDLYNECNGRTPSDISLVDTASIPTTIIDADGEIITGYLYGDNYYELYVNGRLVGVDAVPFTPFNSSIVKFKARRPVKYAIKLVDWEENLGTGTELNSGNPFHAGDGGFIAKFSDGTVTNSSWKAQTFYIAPVTDARCVTENGSSRNSSSCNSTITNLADAYALHWEVPSNWFDTGYDFNSWPNATIFTDAEVGPKVAYTNFTPQFSGAQFIWSSNIILDNLVLLRFTGN